MHKFIPVLLSLIISLVGTAQKNKGFTIAEREDKKQVDILFNNKLLTAYCYYESGSKPILFPVNTVDGITVTRGYPFKKVAGERTDHPHHTGIWLNYESVNGIDFWNNSTAIPLDKKNKYGTILHEKIIRKKASGNAASLTVGAKWIRDDKKVLLHEQTTFNFAVKENDFIIDRITTLKATDTTIVFKDVKDGMLAIRVARDLEMPSNEASKFVDDNGNETNIVKTSNEGVTGMYHSSQGLKGDSVWSSKGPWVILTGKKEGKDITIGIIDHPSNVGYPAYWHARGYGLFAVNPSRKKGIQPG
ncbi:MAG: PmoA family protein [Chitinophagaceae bacterium]